ncbi:hypothetical protein LCGC14_2070900 [marine sediment metagenome]|uniref:DUF86 domain-containing protein n=1 Tax=marine sediment metagenome TaxID=412755 RepID=A0A0F9HFH7_9ZZZZ|nr:DUF86 domain-containing protein [Candidatus Scalindua sediminis]
MRKEFQQRLLRHINFLEIEIEDYTKFKGLKKEEYIIDRDKRRSVERWVENIINSSVDISKIILLLEDINLPDSYKEIVASVSAVEDLSAVEAEALSNWVKFRNIVTHEYLDIRWASIRKFIDQTNPLYKNFLEKIKGYLEKRLQT